MVPNWPGQWRRQELPEMRKEASPGRLAATGELGEHSKIACVLEWVRGPLFIARRGRSAAAVDKPSGEPPLCSQGDVAATSASGHTRG